MTAATARPWTHSGRGARYSATLAAEGVLAQIIPYAPGGFFWCVTDAGVVLAFGHAPRPRLAREAARVALGGEA